MTAPPKRKTVRMNGRNVETIQIHRRELVGEVEIDPDGNVPLEAGVLLRLADHLANSGSGTPVDAVFTAQYGSCRVEVRLGEFTEMPIDPVDTREVMDRR